MPSAQFVLSADSAIGLVVIITDTIPKSRFLIYIRNCLIKA